MIKPSIRSKIAKLADVNDGSAKSLVGDKISESIDSHWKGKRQKTFSKI